MKYSYFTITLIFLLLNNYMIGQQQKYQYVDKSELQIMNDLSSSLDSSINFVISPIATLDKSDDWEFGSDFLKKYNFSAQQFKNLCFDTLIISKNNHFFVINPDTLIKHRNENLEFVAKNRDRKDVNIFNNLLLVYIEKKYGKKALCSINRPIFSMNKRFAIISYYIDCGFLCGFGETLLMEKRNGKWIEIDQLGFVQS